MSYCSILPLQKLPVFLTFNLIPVVSQNQSGYYTVSNIQISFPMNKGNDPIFHRFGSSIKKIIFYSILLAWILPVTACGQTEQVQGLHESAPNVHAFTNVTIVVSPGDILENATLVIRGGVVADVGTDITPPPDARIWEMDGKTIYPGFIDAHSRVGMNEPRTELERGDLSWNPQLRSQLSASDEFQTEEDVSKELRKQGFTTALSVPPLGIFRGQTAVMNLGNGSVSDRIVRTNVAHSVSLRRSNELGQGYPTSPIGSIALIRQTLLDADWYQRAHSTYQSNPQGLTRPESNAALRALEDVVRNSQPVLFEAVSDEEIIRSLRIADEFSITPWIRGSGHEYQLVDFLSGQNVPLIIPIAFPDKPDVDSPEDALNQNLATLRHWYLAPENPARLEEAGILFSLTTDGLDNPAHFLPNLRKAVKLGLSPDAALASLTINPATLFGIQNTHGSIEQGKKANFLITDGDLFDGNSNILDVWVEGERFRIHEPLQSDPRGRWRVVTADRSAYGTLNVEGKPDQLTGSVTINGTRVELASASISDQARRFRASFPGARLDIPGTIRITASLSGDELFGWAEVPGMDRTEWTGERTAKADEQEPQPSETRSRHFSLNDIRPAMEYGRESAPDQPDHVIVRNATIWTMGSEGILENADLLISNGTVTDAGYNLQAPSDAVEIDANGKHVTPGLIDAHLHSGVDGINEIGNSIVPEVRMGDVLNINNIWMYRQLAGGLTTAHVMHGSANPIGGQNQHLKMRWGSLSDDLKMEGAPRTVKFALGENVKRVGTYRYPETRMGTQQIMADHFRAARDYQARWSEWEQSRQGIPPRRDLRMEALVDILEGDILIQAHSYRQDEILMLMRLAEEFDISIKAFHHGVEAYKVSPELAEHGAGAVVWSDWSSFKIEAYDATVFNARLLTEAGVLTSLHSDNSQIASRMNWEAAKMVRAGMDEEEALALITINTAKLLGIDDRVGSLEPGKDADFVIWNGNPLSTMTKAEQTWIDGRKYFDISEDRILRRAIEEERARLIRIILED
jgi:imidazolonepropionase-like amidohydrolase